MIPAPWERPVGVGVLGLGFMGRTHLAAYHAAAAAGFPNTVVAVCDLRAADLARAPSPGRDGRGNLESHLETGALEDGAALGAAEAMTDPEALFARDDVELVSLCTPTDSHVELAARALRAGKHVLVEKPVALAPEPIRELMRVADESERLCLPAMCMRFWPGWSELARRCRSGELGAVRRARFRRLSPRPDWSSAFYDDFARSGGPLIDLHVHDADLVLWLFGAPRAVHCTGSETQFTTEYDFGGEGPAVHAEGAWHAEPEREFFMGFELELEGATLDYAIGREPPLRIRRAGQERFEPLPVAPGTGYDGEVRAALACVARGDAFGPSLEQAWHLAHLLEAERRSLATGERVALEG